MPINSPGTLAFAPRGFDFQRSFSSTNPMINGLETFYWDPAFRGFSGDLAVSQIFTGLNAGVINSWVYSPTVGRTCVYPCPLTLADPAVPGQTLAGTPQAIQPLGVIVQFRYYPASGNGNDPVTVQNFVVGTALYPGTAVEVDILADLHAIYRVQTNSPWGYTGVITTNTYMRVGGLTTYNVTCATTGPNTVINLTFPDGVATGAQAGSRAYVFMAGGQIQAGPDGSGTLNPVSINSSAAMLSVNTTQQIGNPLVSVKSIGLAVGIDGNRNTTATSTVYPYVYVDAAIVNSSFSRVAEFEAN